MNMVVYVKQVIDPSSNTVVPPSGVPPVINPFDLNALEAAAEVISKICEENGAIEVLMAETRAEQDNILKIRGEIPSAQKAEGSVGDFLDICVPPASLTELMERMLEIEEKYDTRIPVTGHSVDGNLHPTPLKELADRGLLEKVKEDIYKATIS